ASLFGFSLRRFCHAKRSKIESYGSEMKILLTGVSSGIGLFLAEALRAEEVWGLARRSPPAKSCTHFSHCDVTRWDAVERVAAEILTKWKYLDAIIHCAGTLGAVGEAMNLDPAKWVSTVRA